jgi:hypothetical protein
LRRLGAIIPAKNPGHLGGSRDPVTRKRLEDLGLDVASREQQRPEGLAAFQKAEIERWLPFIKAAGIKAQ